MWVDDHGERRSIVILPRSEPTTIVTEVFPEPSWNQLAVDGERQDPVSKLRLSSEYYSLEISFSTLVAASTVAGAIQDMVEDGLDAMKLHSDLTPRVRVQVIKPLKEQSPESISVKPANWNG